MHVNVIEARYNRYGILSLTHDPFSYATWNSYANAHKGFLIDLGPSPDLDQTKCFKSEKLLSGPVSYVDRYEIEIDRKIGPDGYQTYDYLNRDLFLTKTSHWEKEQEYRVVISLSECPEYVEPPQNTSHRDYNVYLFPYDPSFIMYIVFGACMDPRKKKRIIELTYNYEITHLQAMLNKINNCELYYLQIADF
jgi:hypothetical protein